MHIYKEKFIFDKFEIFDLLYADFCDRKSLYELFLHKLKPYFYGKVLDFGCGSKPYQSLVEVEKYIGIDTEDSGHPWDDKSIGKPDVLYDGKQLPFENEYFDCVFSSQVFEHIEDIDNSISEIRRVMHVGGILIVTMPMAEEEHEIPFDFRRFTEIGLKSYLEKAGFCIIESGKINNYRNSLRILKIGMVCHMGNNGIFSKIRKHFFILKNNLEYLLLGNKIEENLIFSNKVYCIARKSGDVRC